MARIDLSSMSVGAEECGDVSAGAPAFRGDMSLGKFGTTLVPLGVRNGRVFGSMTGVCRDVFVSGALSARPLLVSRIDGGVTEVFVGQEGGGRLWKASLGEAGGSQHGSAALPGSTFPRGLYFSGPEFVGGGIAGNGNFVLANADGHLSDAGVVDVVAAINASAPAIGAGYYLYGSYDNISEPPVAYLVRGDMRDGGFGHGELIQQPVSVAGSEIQLTTPIIGEGGFVYVVGGSGVGVHSAADAGQLWVWNEQAGVASEGVAQPALDVYRATNGSARCGVPLGLLYTMRRVPGQAAAKVTALLVDSRGLDSVAPWPKYQRDNANTGNVSFVSGDWSCQ